MSEALRVPQSTALLMMECQVGVLDPSGKFGFLGRRSEEKGMLAAIGKVLGACRETKRPVVHCLAAGRADGGGRFLNAPLLRGSGTSLLTDPERARVVAPLTPIASDYQVARLHGVSPFHDTELDSILRSLGVTTIIATGVSANVAITGMLIEAVNRGYEAILPTDCIAGAPTEYEELQIKFCYRNLATLTTADDVVAAMSA
ncbi:MAG: cysteine hydrolase [Candidatus Binatia bacterium]